MASRAQFLTNSIRNYFEATYDSRVASSRTGRFPTPQVRKFYDTQLKYIRRRAQFGSCSTFVINFEHLQAFQSGSFGQSAGGDDDDRLMDVDIMEEEEGEMSRRRASEPEEGGLESFILANFVQEFYLREYDTIRQATFDFIFSRLRRNLEEARDEGRVSDDALDGDTPGESDSHFERDLQNFRPERLFVGFSHVDCVKTLRELKCGDIGQLVQISGTVTRTGQVRPELFRGKFICADCGHVQPLVSQRFVYTKPSRCENSAACKNTSRFQLDLDGSDLINFQKIRVQENTEAIPSGMIPRTMQVIVRNDLVEVPKPGDKMSFVGTLIVLPDVAKMVSRKIASESAAPNDGIGAGAMGQVDIDGDRSGRRGRSSSSKKTDGEAGGAVGGAVRGLRILGVRDMSYRLVFLAHYCHPSVSEKAANTRRRGAGAFFVHGREGQDDLGELHPAAAIDSFSETLLHHQHDLEDRKALVQSEPGRVDGASVDVDSSATFLNSLSQDELIRIEQMKSDDHILRNLVSSIAPCIYGYKEIKKGILLQMVGGVHKVTPAEGIHLRGDINICMVGDPGVAKSQFLKYVSSMLPRAIYTSGRASSSAGLTASVVKQADTGEFAIEAGALMLADNGICCIDEFDKMSVFDQVAIHEAMEQQTISIAKAGIRATLHARTSILAAANPVGGRYNKAKTLMANIGYTLSPAIISRFDLFFVVCDEFEESVDRRIAEHILKVHRGSTKVIKPKYTPNDIRLFIRYIQANYHPTLTAEAMRLLEKTYVAMRQRDKVQSHAFRVTVRQLESLVRLSEAIARVYGDMLVRERHVKEAIQLLQKTMTKLEVPDVQLDVGETDGYLKEIRQADSSKRLKLLNRIRANLRDCEVAYKEDERRLNQAREKRNELETESEELVGKERALQAGIGSPGDDDLHSVTERRDAVDRELEKLARDIKGLRAKAKASKKRFDKEKRREEDLFRDMPEDLRRKVAADDRGEGGDDIDDDGMSVPVAASSDVSGQSRRKRRKKRHPTFRAKLSQEIYRLITRKCLDRFRQKTREEGLVDSDQPVTLTVRELVDAASEVDLGDDHSKSRAEKLLLKVITRLIAKDNILIDLNMGQEKFEEHNIIVNPNFDLDT